MRFHIALSALAASLVGACGETPTLPQSNRADGTPYLSPYCEAHRAELKALDVTVLRVPKDFPLMAQNNARGLWLGNKTILVSTAVSGWLAEDVIAHEKCHEMHYRAFGNGQFHR